MPFRKVIGAHSCREALKTRRPEEIKKIFLKPDWQKSSVLKSLALMAQDKGLKVELMSVKKLQQIAEAHQGVCVLLSHYMHFNIDSVGKNSVVLLLNGLQDSKNFGAIVRTAWLMGVECIFASKKHSLSLSPAMAKTASGGLEHVPVEWRHNLRECAEELKKHQFWIYGLDPQAKRSIYEEKFEGRVAFVLGGESSGLKRGMKKACDTLLSIPQKHSSANYNVSVSASLALGELFRQIRQAP